MNTTANTPSPAPASHVTLLAHFSPATVRQLELTIQAAARDLRRAMREVRLVGTPKAQSPTLTRQEAQAAVQEQCDLLERLLKCASGTAPQPISEPVEPAPLQELTPEPEPAPAAPTSESHDGLLPHPLPESLSEIDRLYNAIKEGLEPRIRQHPAGRAP